VKKKESKTAQLHIRLTEEDKNTLERLAKRRGVSISQFVTDLIYEKDSDIMRELMSKGDVIANNNGYFY